jgi:TPR repeat protein
LTGFALAVAIATPLPLLAQDSKGAEMRDVLPIPVHSTELLDPTPILNGSDPLAGGFDSSAAPGSMGIMAPSYVKDGQFIILRAPTPTPQPSVTPQAQTKKAETVAPQAGFNYLRAQKAAQQYRLDQASPIHAPILKAIASGDSAGAASAAQSGAQQGDIASARYLASSFQFGTRTYNLQQWLRWTDRATRLGDVAAQYELGRIYAAGLTADVTGTGEAMPINLRMCWKESDDCAYGLGVIGVQTGLPESANFIRHAASRAQPKAMLWLGRAMTTGAYGQSHDPVMAAVWLKLAAMSSVPEAPALYSELYASFSPAKRKSVDVSVQQMVERFSRGGVYKKRHARNKAEEEQGFFAQVFDYIFDTKVKKPAEEGLNSALAAR